MRHGESRYEHHTVVYSVRTFAFLIAVKYQQGFQCLPCNWKMGKAEIVCGKMVQQLYTIYLQVWSTVANYALAKANMTDPTI